MSTRTITNEAEVSNDLRASRIITNAKNILLTDGWMKGDYQCDETGRRCAVGALRFAAFGTAHSSFDHPDYLTALRAVAGAISKKGLKSAEAYHCAEAYHSVLRHFTTLIDDIEDVVTGFNDERVQTDVGRNAVLRKFDKALATLS